METKSHYTLVGAFVLMVAVSIIIMFAWIHRKDNQDDSLSYLIYFQNSVTGISQGSLVKYKGIPVGTVTSLDISPRNIEEIMVQIAVRNNTPMRQGMTASIEIAGITGECYIQLTGADPSASPLVPEKGQKYAVIPSRESSLQEIFRTTPELLSHADIAIERLSGFLTPANQKAVASLLIHWDKVGEMLETFDMQGLNQLFTSAKETFSELRALASLLRSVIEENRAGLKSLMGEGVYNFNDLVVNFTETLGHINTFLEEVMDEIRALFPAPSQKTYRLR